MKIPDEVRSYMSELGQKAAKVNKQKGSAYFKWVRSHGKVKSEPPKGDSDGSSIPDSAGERSSDNSSGRDDSQGPGSTTD